MKNFEMIVNDVFYLNDGRTVFSGKFFDNISVQLPIDVTIYVNDVAVGKIKLITVPFSSGKNIRKDIDVIETSDQINLEFVKWGQDKVILKSLTS